MIPFKDRRIALIGGGGFIGHNLALTLNELGADVTIIDSFAVNNLLAFSSSENDTPNKEHYIEMLLSRQKLLKEAGIRVVVQDARHYHELSHALNDVDPQVVVQLAAVSHANKSNKDPYSTFDHSFRTLENALDWSRSRVEQFIYFSSSMIYGHFEGGMVTEDTPCDPLGIYGALKFGGEKLVIAYNQAFDMPYTIIRPSALYGRRCVSRRVGQIFIENAMLGKEIVISGDGSDCLDFTYIDDFVQGVVKAIENKNSHNEVFNITYGAGQPLSVLADIIGEEFPDVPIKYVPKDKLMPDRGTLSVDKARKLIGYDPQWPLERGFREYIKWYRDNTNF